MISNKILYTYALVKSLYDKEDDYIDSFWPLVINVFPESESLAVEEIKNSLIKVYELNIPIHVLSTILKRATRRGYLVGKNKKYTLTPQGKNYLDNQETIDVTHRRIGALVKDMVEFFNKQEHGQAFTEEKIKDMLFCFVKNNIEPLIEFLSPKLDIKELQLESSDFNVELLAKYIKEVKNYKPEHFNTLKDLVLGSIISTVVYTAKDSNIEGLKNKKFKKTKVFLDSNFIFSLLDLHDEQFCEPAKELLNLLKKIGFELKTFDITVDEICRVIKKYPEESYKYPASLKIGSIYSTLKRKGWGKSEAVEFISNIERILWDRNIEIWTTSLSDNDYQSIYKWRDKIKAYKHEQSPSSQNHDLIIIHLMQKLRGKSIRRIEEAKTLFLTSDARLSRFNFEEMGHKDKGTICEVILDKLLTNILWLKDPKIDIPLEKIVAVHSQGLFIKRRVWEKFYDVLRAIKRECRINEENITALFYHGYIEEELKEIDEGEIERIDRDFVIERIERASRFREKSEEEKIKKKEKEFLQKLDSEVSLKEQEMNRKLFEKVDKIKDNLRKSAEKESNKKARRISCFISLGLTILVIVIIILLIKFSPPFLLKLLSFLFSGSGILVIGWIWIKFRKRIKYNFFYKFSKDLYNQKLEEASLSQNEQ